MLFRLLLTALFFALLVLSKLFVRDLPKGTDVAGRDGYIHFMENVDNVHNCIDKWYYDRMKVIMFDRAEKRCRGYQVISRVVTAAPNSSEGYFLTRKGHADCSANVLQDLNNIVECMPGWFRIVMPSGPWCYYVLESSEYNPTGASIDSHSIEHSCSRLYKGSVCASIHSAEQERIIISESQLYSPNLEGIILGMCPANTPPQNWTYWTDRTAMDYTNWSVDEDIEKSGCIESKKCSTLTPVLMFHGTPDWVLDDPLAGRPILCQYKG